MRQSILWLLCLMSPLVMASDTDEYTVELYDLYCTACHAVEASGAPQAFSDDFRERLDDNGLETLVNHAINGTGNMPAMGTCAECMAEDIEALILYMTQEKPE